MLSEAVLLESIASRCGYNLSLSTAAAMLYSCSHLGSCLWKQKSADPCLVMLLGLVLCIKPSEAASSVFCI